MSNAKQTQAKIVVEFSAYRGIVLDADKALQIMNLMRGAESFKEKYRTEGSTLHVYTDEEEEFVKFRYLTDEQYALAKVRGKPEQS